MVEVDDVISDPVNHAAKFDLSMTKEEIEVDAIDTAKDADNAEFPHWKPDRHE